MSRIGESLLRGANEALLHAQGKKLNGLKKHVVKVPAQIDVRAIRKKLKMDREVFAERFGFSVRTLEKWEQGVRVPESPTRAYLKVIAHNPAVVEKALSV